MVIEGEHAVQVGASGGRFAKQRSVMTVGRGATVVVVEDDDSMREAIERLLNAAGFECEAFSSATALLARGVDQESVCVISDLKLPGMSGLELLGVLKERNPSMPFILITAHGSMLPAWVHGGKARIAAE